MDRVLMALTIAMSALTFLCAGHALFSGREAAWFFIFCMLFALNTLFTVYLWGRI